MTAEKKTRFGRDQLLLSADLQVSNAEDKSVALRSEVRRKRSIKGDTRDTVSFSNMVSQPDVSKTGGKNIDANDSWRTKS